MANYKNMRGRSYAQQRRSSSGGILKTLGTVLVVFLAIGLIFSLFSRPSADTDPTENPGVTEPMDSTPKLITFTYEDESYSCEAGMTWAEFVESDYNTFGFYLSDDGTYVGTPDGEGLSREGVSLVSPDEVISSDIDYHWTCP